MRTIDLSDLNRKVQVAAARNGLSGSSFIRAAVRAALAECADRDPQLRAIFDSMDSERAERASVPA